eukprot:8754827-Alexandrium_andersonii.AAC.1
MGPPLDTPQKAPSGHVGCTFWGVRGAGGSPGSSWGSGGPWASAGNAQEAPLPFCCYPFSPG